MPGVHDSTTSWPGTKYSTIAAQCCTSGTHKCRRSDTRVVGNDKCIAGTSKQGQIKALTFAQAQNKCDALGLTLCRKSCAGTGCSYNSHPVYTGLPCGNASVYPNKYTLKPPPPAPSAPNPLAPPSPPPLPPPGSPPASAIPAGGVLVINGGKPKVRSLGCLMPGVHDSTTSWPGTKYSTIAAQCCTSGTHKCRRSDTRVVGNDKCIAGTSKQGQIKALTFAQAQNKCDALGLTLCRKSCANTGCYYNEHPVFTSLPCP